MKTFTQKVIALCAGVFLAANMAVYGTTILYDNSTTPTGSNLSFVNGSTIGNEIIMGNPSLANTLTSFSFEFYSAETAFFSSSVQMEVFLYANNGGLVNGYATPNSVLYDSGLFSLPTPLQITSGASLTANINFNLSTPITVPHDFTLAIEVTGLGASDSAGVALFDPATVGSNYGDYWLNGGSGWQLDTLGTRTDFGAQFVGSAIPDAAPTAMLLGAALASLGFLRRKLS